MEVIRDMIHGISSLYGYFLLTFVIVYVTYRFLLTKKYNLPPGPWAFPIIGNYKVAMSYRNYKHWAEELRQKYGDVVLYHEGSLGVVVINDYDIAVEAMVTNYPKQLAGRPNSTILREYSENYNNILASSYGPLWKKERKVTHAAIRKFMSGLQIEVANIKSFRKFVESIPLGRAIDPTDSLYQLTFNITFSVIFGKTYSLDDKEFLYITGLMRESNAVFTDVMYTEVFPILYNFPFPSMKVFKKHVNDFHAFINKKIKEHENTIESDPRDVCESLLLESKESAGKSEEDAINDIHVRQILSGLVFGGTDTTRLTLTWFIGLLATNPAIQQRIYLEIVTYKQSLPKGNDEVAMEWKEHLPYTCAAINETLRYGAVTPKSMIHTAMSDCKIGGYDVPKGYNVYINIYGFHHDPKYWTDPHIFNPDRFIDQNGHFIPKARGFAPFSFGPRVCVGESVGKGNLFLLSTLLCSTFEFIWDESNANSFLTEAETCNFDRFPADFKVKFQRRPE